MDTLTAIVVAAIVVVIVALAIGVYFYYRRRNATLEMQHRFGPEYDRVVGETGNRSRAEERLLNREKRVASYDIHPLLAEDRARFTRLWQNVQAEFVDSPRTAVSHADEVLTDVMAERGYPMSDFERRSADLSVDHPVVVQNYRDAHDIVLRHRDGKASTEDLRRAMIHYKTLFRELVEEKGVAAE